MRWACIPVAVFFGLLGLMTAGLLVQVQDRLEIAASTKRPPIPMPSDCKGCKDAVIPSRVGWLDEER
jgi:hypothetical protein